MDTIQQYNRTSWGRIFLMLRLDIKQSMPSALLLFILFFIAISILPRCAGFFTGDFSATFLSGFDAGARIKLFSPILLGIYANYISNRCHQSKPIAFTLIPANLWEKLVSVIIFLMIIKVATSIMAYCTILFDYLLAPELISLNFDFKDFSLVGMTYNTEFGVGTLGLNFISLASFLIICTQLIRHRGTMKGLVIGLILTALAWTFFGSLCYELINLLGCGATSFFIVVDLALGAYIYYRLKTLEV